MKQVFADSPASGLGLFGHLGEPSVPFDQREWRGMNEEGRGAGCFGDQRKAGSGGAGLPALRSMPARSQARS